VDTTFLVRSFGSSSASTQTSPTRFCPLDPSSVLLPFYHLDLRVQEGRTRRRTDLDTERETVPTDCLRYRLTSALNIHGVR
jgi:hypothetical protein